MSRYSSQGRFVDFRSPEGELILFADGRAIAKAMADAGRARSLYARFLYVPDSHSIARS